MAPAGDYIPEGGRVFWKGAWEGFADYRDNWLFCRFQSGQF